MRGILIAAVIASAVATSAHALTVETTSFITNVTNFNGFEGIGPITGTDGVTSYSEDGISVNYVGAGAIWSESQTAPEGIYSWYPDGGGVGYTSITFAATDQIQFFAGSGFFVPPVSLAYDVLLGGVSVGTGVAGLVPEFLAGFVVYGFSGELFDEVRIQGVPNAAGFDPNAFEALNIDAISLGTAIPEPATWALMIAGFGMVGAAMRGRQAVVAA